MTIKILIVDDQKTVREIIKDYLQEDSRLQIVGFAANGQEAIDAIELHHPNIVLMDIEMPVVDGLTATQIISERFIDTNVLIISVHNEDSYLNAALKVGAKGYLLKNTPAKELINAIYSAHKGYFQLGPGLLEKYLHKVSNADANAKELEQLKTVIVQQSEYLESLLKNQQKSTNKSRRDRRNSSSRSQDYLETQYVNLEKQIYSLSNRLDKVNKKIAILQQSGILMILCGGISIATVLLLGM